MEPTTEMKKYIVFKKVFANELILVEAENESSAIYRVAEGEGVTAKPSLEWNGDLPHHFWVAESIEATDDELEALRRSASCFYEEEKHEKMPKDGDDWEE